MINYEVKIRTESKEAKQVRHNYFLLTFREITCLIVKSGKTENITSFDNLPALTITVPRFHVPFWLSHILVCLFYFCPSFCPSWDRNIINKQRYGYDRKGTWKRGK